MTSYKIIPYVTCSNFIQFSQAYIWLLVWLRLRSLAMESLVLSIFPLSGFLLPNPPSIFNLLSYRCNRIGTFQGKFILFPTFTHLFVSYCINNPLPAVSISLPLSQRRSGPCSILHTLPWNWPSPKIAVSLLSHIEHCQ